MGSSWNNNSALHNAVDLGIGKTERGSPLRRDLNRMVYPLENFLGEQAIMADLFDLKQTAVGLEADFPQREQVAQTLADIKVAGVVDRGFGPQSAAFLVVLLDARSFVIEYVNGGKSGSFIW